MKPFIHNIKNWTKQHTGQLATNVREAIDKFNTSSNIAISDLATIIILHPETHIEQREYLGLVFNDCYLKLDDYLLYLETKGRNHEQILVCTIYQNGNFFSAYHSYKDSKNKIIVPNILLQLQTEPLH